MNTNIALQLKLPPRKEFTSKDFMKENPSIKDTAACHHVLTTLVRANLLKRNKSSNPEELSKGKGRPSYLYSICTKT